MTSVEVATESSAIVKADDTKKETHTLLGGHHEVNKIIHAKFRSVIRHA